MGSAYPVKKEPVSHQFTSVLVQNWYGFTSTCTHVNSRVPHVFRMFSLVLHVSFWFRTGTTPPLCVFTCSLHVLCTCGTGDTGTVLDYMYLRLFMCLCTCLCTCGTGGNGTVLFVPVFT